jgi:5-hydroxyisourate hydrolase
MGQLTTHVLDISAGLPAAGLRIELSESQQPGGPVLASIRTGGDGRCPAPLLSGADFRAGGYVLTFHIADYFRERGVALPDPAFLELAIVPIGIAHPEQHYHVPLLVAPWSYSVYRGG